MALAAAVLILAVGFCLLEGSHAGTSDHGMSPDLCGGLLVMSLVLVLLPKPLPGGSLALDPALLGHAVSLQLLDPPPRSRSL